jgi:CBS domain-containing protein
VDTTTSIRQAAKLMRAERVSSVLVLAENRLCGIVTDKDLRVRVLAEGLDPTGRIEMVMTPNPVTVDASSDVDAALLLMMRGNYHHLPIMNQGRAVGLLTAGDLLRTQSEHPLRLVRDIHNQDGIDSLIDLSHRLPALFERMVSLGRDVEQIGRLFTLIADTFTVRLIRLAEQSLGPPPMAWAWVAFGSQAREEQTVKTDQDNGLVLEREPREEEAAYFAELSRHVCKGLDQLGYVYCPGEVMALNAKWRVSLAGWKQHFDQWIEQPDPKSVMHSSIFFDSRCVHGALGLVEKLQQHANEAAAENQIFLRFMAANALSHSPPLGFFRRFVQEDDGSQSEGLNLKHRGIVPITDLVRIRALESGIDAANTFERIQLAKDSGHINDGDASSLRDALTLINRIRLKHQSVQILAGEKPTNHVPVEDLSPLLRRNLKAAFMLVKKAQESLASRYQVH